MAIPIFGNNGIEKFAHKENFVGDNNVDSVFGGVQFRLTGDNLSALTIKISVSGSLFSNDDQVYLCIDQECSPFSKEKKYMNIEL